MKRKRHRLTAFILAAVFIGGGYGVYYAVSIGHLFHAHQKKQELYTCPMHPQIVQEGPGNCPICGMKLVVLKTGEPVKKKTRYRSTMNPDETSDHPGKDSMGMEMVPYEISVTDKTSPGGTASFRLEPEQARSMGVTYGKASYRELAHRVRSTARIVPDETRQYRITSRVEGWIETLYVNQTGQMVKKGDPLYAVYSPDLLSSVQEYLSTLAALEKGDILGDRSLASSLEQVRDAARARLVLLGMSEENVLHVERTRKAGRTVTMYSPASGYVMEKPVIQGQRIMMNEPLFVIADLSTVWAEADILEADIPYVKTGQSAEIRFSYWPGKIFRGKVSFISPVLKDETRTLAVRITIPNGGLVLKSGMYADAVISHHEGRKLSVPDGAVMRTGLRSYVFVKSDDMIFPREIDPGLRDDEGFVEVIRGLKAGDVVVTSANFLIDSESSMRSALQKADEARTSP